MPLFVYGTLRHLPLLTLILGRDLPAAQRRPARLPGHRAVWAEEQAFPLIVAAEGHSAEGLLLEGLSGDDLARLEFYEGGFGYHLRPVMAEVAGGEVPARVWFPDPGLWQEGAAWELADWQARWGAINCAAAAEVMGWFGLRGAAEVARMYPMILARAASRVAAGQGVPPDDPALPRAGLTRADTEVRGLARPYADFFAVEDYRLSFRRFDGAMSREVKRAVFMAADAAIVLPYDPLRDRVLLIEQFRVGPFARGDLAPWSLEPVAGRVDPGEPPEQAARREALEEAGLELRHLERIGGHYPSPGSTSEFFHVFVGLTDLPDSTDSIGGVSSEDEDIRSHVLPYAQFQDLLDRDLLNVGPLVLAGHWLARHRTRLRAAP